MDYFGNSPETQDKPDGTKVSAADYAVDAYLRQHLMDSRPGYGWLSEETEDDFVRLDRDRVWIVDPIDGTRAFLQGKTQWAVSAALVEHGRPLLACVYNPACGELFSARRGSGATLNDKPIAVSDASNLEGSRIVASKQIFRSSKWPKPWPEMNVFWANSIAYRICLVADGRADATLSLSKKSDWDLAAADLLVQEAGGYITTPEGTALRYNARTPRHPGIIAAARILHAHLLDRVGAAIG